MSVGMVLLICLIFSDLIKQVKTKLPEDAAVPSEATVIYSFAPTNAFSRSPQYYTGKINLKHTIQRRQLRSYHTDSHWCNALYRYVREIAITQKESCIFLSCDDKAKVDFGESGALLSTGVRGKKSIVQLILYLVH